MVDSLRGTKNITNASTDLPLMSAAFLVCIFVVFLVILFVVYGLACMGTIVEHPGSTPLVSNDTGTITANTSTNDTSSTINDNHSSCHQTLGCSCTRRKRKVVLPEIGEILDHEPFQVENVAESSGTSTLVLSCIDYRFVRAVDELVRDEEGLEYWDAFALAGGSLGYNQSNVFPTWPQTWLDHVTLARSLHGIHQIVVVEHMDCGMYKQIYPNEHTPALERARHIENIHTFKTAMDTILTGCPGHPIAIRGYLLYRDGHSERIV